MQRALPHSLELLVADKRSHVENIESAWIVQTRIAAADIHLRISGEMADSFTYKAAHAYQHQRPQGANDQCPRQAERYDKEIPDFF